MNTKVLITGGSGFVGSHIADKILLDDSSKVVVIDNYETGRRDNLRKHKNLTIVEGSIVDRDLVFQLMKDHDINLIIHAAASYKDPHNWLEDSKTNVTGTVNMIQAAQEFGVKRFIYFQTALCYGLKPEESPITLNHPILPGGSSYAISKTAGEFYLQLSGLDYVTFRLANVYGPRNVSGPLPVFYHRLTNNKKCFVMDTRRDFVYVDDLVNVVMGAVNGKGHGTFHVSSGSDVSIKDLFDETTDSLGMNIDVEIRPRNPDDAPSILLNPKRTNETFNWEANTPLKKGVKDTIEYYHKFGIEETFTHLKNED